MGELQKCLQMSAREVKEAVSQAGQEMLVGTQKTSPDENVDGKGQDREVSVGNKDSLGCWSSSHYILAGHLSVFCPRPETLQEADMKGADSSVGGNPKQLNTQAVAWYCWLLLAKSTVRIRSKCFEKVSVLS